MREKIEHRSENFLESFFEKRGENFGATSDQE